MNFMIYLLDVAVGPVIFVAIVGLLVIIAVVILLVFLTVKLIVKIKNNEYKDAE
jgi:flagellar biogenesis protein FliO